MTDPRSLVRSALDAISVIPPTGHRWFATRVDGPMSAADATVAPREARAHLLWSLQTRLYADFYCSGAARPTLDMPPMPPPALTPFLQSLSAANTGSGVNEPGWRVVAANDQGLVVERQDGLRFRALASEVSAEDGASVGPGADVSVLLPKELLRLSPGFYMALGDTALRVDGTRPLVRLYWHIRPDGASRLIGDLTTHLNLARLPFRLKVASDPSGYGRCDAGVLYVPRSTYPRVRSILTQVHAGVRAWLLPGVPALTREIAQGLGVAEDPAGGTSSFGLSRCAIIAEGIIRAAERNATDTQHRLDIVEQCFAEAGLRLDLPHLEPGSSGDYDLTG